MFSTHEHWDSRLESHSRHAYMSSFSVFLLPFVGREFALGRSSIQGNLWKIFMLSENNSVLEQVKGLILKFNNNNNPAIMSTRLRTPLSDLVLRNFTVRQALNILNNVHLVRFCEHNCWSSVLTICLTYLNTEWTFIYTESCYQTQCDGVIAAWRYFTV
jgi:hypothetical protein